MVTTKCLNPLTLMSDQDRISPYNINTISTRQVMRIHIKKNISFRIFWLIQYQILRTSIMRIAWQTVRSITNEIIGIKTHKQKVASITYLEAEI